MAEYIDREEAIAKMMLAYTLLQRDYLKKTIDAIPAADVAPVIHAHWVLEPNAPGSVFAHYECSECKNRELRVRTHYCPHCGASMDGEVDDG